MISCKSERAERSYVLDNDPEKWHEKEKFDLQSAVDEIDDHNKQGYRYREENYNQKVK